MKLDQAKLKVKLVIRSHNKQSPIFLKFIYLLDRGISFWFYLSCGGSSLKQKHGLDSIQSEASNLCQFRDYVGAPDRELDPCEWLTRLEWIIKHSENVMQQWPPSQYFHRQLLWVGGMVGLYNYSYLPYGNAWVRAMSSNRTVPGHDHASHLHASILMSYLSSRHITYLNCVSSQSCWCWYSDFSRTAFNRQSLKRVSQFILPHRLRSTWI